MAKKRFTAEQIVAILREAEKATTNEEVLRKHGISEQTFYRWKRMYGNLGTLEVQRIKQLESENRKLKQLAGDQPRPGFAGRGRERWRSRFSKNRSKKGVLIEDQRDMVKAFTGFGFSERRACLALQISRVTFPVS
jgi:putative transposase